MIQKKGIKTFVFSFAILLLIGCSHPAVYNQYQEIERAEWAKDKVFYFTFMVDDISVPYDISLNIRNNNLYSYRNLWLLISEEKPIGTLSRDTLDCILADEFGKWQGKGISVFHSTIPLHKSYYFPLEGQYTFGIRQGMRSDLLQGIEKIGLKIEKTK